MLNEERYKGSLKTRESPYVKKRYSAMKKYHSYVDCDKEFLQKPFRITFESKPYTVFTNNWSVVMTTENVSDMDMYVSENGKYPPVKRTLTFDGIKKKIDFEKVIEQAKHLGYRLSKKEVGSDFRYLMLYDGTYYKIGLIEATFGIINTGGPALTYHQDGITSSLIIQTNLGFAVIAPVRCYDDPETIGKTVIEV